MSLPLMPAPIDMVHVPYRDRGQGDPRRQHQAGVIQPYVRSGSMLSKSGRAVKQH